MKFVIEIPDLPDPAWPTFEFLNASAVISIAQSDPDGRVDYVEYEITDLEPEDAIVNATHSEG